LDPDTATIDTLRTDIALALREYIERTGISQAKAGTVFGLKQSVVSHIVRGEIRHLSIERLIKAMVKAKLPGFAEWGESSEEARAGTGYRPSISQTAVIRTPIFSFGGKEWTDANAKNSSAQVAVISHDAPVKANEAI
jgi:predicted XRE-type DNA-binding protein